MSYWLRPVAWLIALLAVHSPGTWAQPQWVAPGPPAAAGSAPFWIWAVTSDNLTPTRDFARAGTVWLARTFDWPRQGPAVRSARLALAADNHAVAYFNGAEVLRSDSWSSVRFADVTVRPGENLLAVEAINDAVAGGKNPAGVIARLDLVLDDGTTRSLCTDGLWRGADVKWPGFPGAGPGRGDAWPAPTVGRSESAPWHLSVAAFEPARPCPMLRRVFSVDDVVTRASIRIIGLGHYELRCNGALVGDSVINQAWSQYDKTLYWQEFDLTRHVRRGDNVLAVTLGNSFWRVDAPNDTGRYSKTDAMPDFSKGWPHLLWLDATIQTPAGVQHITSDAGEGGWKWSESPLTFSHIYAGEDFDARLIQSGWDSPGFDDHAWKPVVLAPTPGVSLAALPGPAIKESWLFEPSEIKRPAPGIFTYVFPQNCSALLRFTLTGGRAGARVRFKPCEYMDDSGRVKFTYTWGTHKDIWHDYIKAGEGEESHQVLFCYVGAQFVQVEGAVPPGEANPDGLPVLTRLEQVHVRAACPTVGTFSCSSEMHDAAHRLIDWSIRSNMSHVPTDCPHREKNGWLEQDWHMARAMSYTYDVHEWLGKTCHDIRDTQLVDGHVPTNSPNYLVGVPPHGFWNEAPEWGIAAVLVPWHLYEWYGDTRILEESYESARRYVDYLSTTAKDGVITSNLGDWYDFGHGKGNGPSQWTPNEVSATAIWALGARTLAEMAGVLGREEDVASYHQLYEQIRRDFQVHFYDATTHTVKNNGSCQAGNAAALCIGLIPEIDRAEALRAIRDDLESRGWKQTPGEVLQVFLIRALAEGGPRGVEALHHIYNREDIPSYGHMVASGLTTLPESWDARRGTGDSLNHFMLGHLMEWHYAYVAGIRQQAGSVGWKKVLIAPQPPARSDPSPNAIRSAAATFAGPTGRIVSRWTIEGEKFSLVCEIPTGVEAVAVLPDGSRHPLAAGTSNLSCPAP